MKSLRDALPEYLVIRRALGTQLKEGGMALSHFLDFMEAEGAEVITLQIALRWAMLPADVQIATWARRLGQVRGFAAWRSSFDPRTEVPPDRMLGARRLRNPPHIYTEKEVLALMAGAAKLPKGKIRPWTYRTLLGHGRSGSPPGLAGGGPSLAHAAGMGFSWQGGKADVPGMEGEMSTSEPRKQYQLLRRVRGLVGPEKHLNN